MSHRYPLAALILLIIGLPAVIFAALLPTRFWPKAATVSNDNQALKLDGQTTYVKIPASDNIPTLTSDFTIEMWLKPLGYAAFDNYILWKYKDETFHEYEYLLTKEPMDPSGTGNGQVCFNIYQSKEKPEAISPALRGKTWLISNGNKWYHLAIVKKNLNVKLFINGRLDAEGNMDPLAIRDNNWPLYLGSAFTYDGTLELPFSGEIDEFRISNLARYENNFFPQKEPFAPDANTALLYHFDGNFLDSSAFGNTGLGNGNFQFVASTVKKYPDYSVIPVIFVPKDQTVPDAISIEKIQTWISYLQAWHAARLNGKTFSSIPPIIHRAGQNNDWYSECHPPYPWWSTENNCERSLPVIHYHNVLKELDKAGFPVGAPSVARQNLLVFFQGPVNNYPALGGDENQGVNMSFIALPFVSNLYEKNPFSLNIGLQCPFAGGDCDFLKSLGNIAHEMAHTFGLSHLPPEAPEKQSNRYGSSIIDNPSLFPHNAFFEDGPNDEMIKMLASPFMNFHLSSFPSPLSQLQVHRAQLFPGWNLISIPEKLPYLNTDNGETTPGLIRYNLGETMEKILILTGVDANGKEIWATYNNQPTGFQIKFGQGFWIKMREAANLKLYGYSPENPPAISLRAGWNLVGPTCWNCQIDSPESFRGLGTDFELAYGYYANDINDPWKIYNPEMPAFLYDLRKIASGLGYWIKVKNNSTWFPLPPGNSPQETVSIQKKGVKNAPSLPQTTNPTPTPTAKPSATPTPTLRPCPNYWTNCVKINKNCPPKTKYDQWGQCGPSFKCCLPIK